MKKFFYTLLFVSVTAFTISACSDEHISPAPSDSTDKCQFGGPGCPKSGI